LYALLPILIYADRTDTKYCLLNWKKSIQRNR